jgi:hypothetical protein
MDLNRRCRRIGSGSAMPGTPDVCVAQGSAMLCSGGRGSGACFDPFLAVHTFAFTGTEAARRGLLALSSSPCGNHRDRVAATVPGAPGGRHAPPTLAANRTGSDVPLRGRRPGTPRSGARAHDGTNAAQARGGRSRELASPGGGAERSQPAAAATRALDRRGDRVALAATGSSRRPADAGRRVRVALATDRRARPAVAPGTAPPPPRTDH